MMKRTATILAIVLAFAVGAAGQGRGSKGTAPESAQYPPLAKTEAEKRILATMYEMVKAGELYANVPAVDGKMLRLLTEAAREALRGPDGEAVAGNPSDCPRGAVFGIIRRLVIDPGAGVDVGGLGFIYLPRTGPKWKFRMICA